MFRRLQKLPVGQRRFVYLMLFGGGIVALIGLTLTLIALTLRVERANAIGLVPGVEVREYVALPDDDAYPAAVAVAPDGTLFTGSFATGVVWRIAPDLQVSEVPNTRERIGAVSALALLPDGALLVVDAVNTDPRSAGGALWRVVLDGQITPFGSEADNAALIAPDDATLDAAGRIYVTDRGRNLVLRFAADGSASEVWWSADQLPQAERRRALTGLAYDPIRDAVLVTEPELGEIYRISIADRSFEILYRHGERPNAPGFNGIDVAPDGTIYAAALAQNGIARVHDGALDYIAGLFRGASDVAYVGGRLFVPNFDQTSLIVPLYRPALPFAIDVIALPGSDAG